MERNERCSKQIIACFFYSLLLSVSVEAGGIISMCRQSPAVIVPAPVPPPVIVIDRVERKTILIKPMSASSLRKERIKRRVKFIMARKSSSGNEHFDT